MRYILFLSSLAGLSQLIACGPDCQSTCNRLYRPADGVKYCGIARPGKSIDESISYCMTQCNSALETPGDVGEYNPNDETPRSETPELLNDKQAAVWMDCVSNTSCPNLEANYCAPIW